MRAGVAHVPVPGLVDGTVLHTKAEALLPATDPPHATWLVSALPHEDHRLSTTAHRHATIGKQPNEFNLLKTHSSFMSNL